LKGVVDEMAMFRSGGLKNSTHVLLTDADFTVGTARPAAAPISRRPTWAQAEGSPLPLGATWIEEEQAFNRSF
jgi:hypothetical protein